MALVELNSATDNPLVFLKETGEGDIISGGNFHGQIVSIAMDLMSIAVAELASISEQRLEKLVNPAISDLPPFLTPQSGLNSGFMIVQVAAASIVSENKTLCHPASVDSIPTSANQEDHVSMAAHAARRLLPMAQNAASIVAIELLAAAQGCHFHGPLQSSAALERVRGTIRERVSFMDRDRYIHPDLVVALELVQHNHIIDAAGLDLPALSATH